jgi:hypothetical protein
MVGAMGLLIRQDRKLSFSRRAMGEISIRAIFTHCRARRFLPFPLVGFRIADLPGTYNRRGGKLTPKV